MATYVRARITDNIAATLATITEANGYATDIKTAERVVKIWSEVGDNELPWIGFAITETRRSPPDHGGGVLRCTASVTIGAHINAATPEEATVQLAALEDDILAAMYEDCGRGVDADGNPNAIDTIWQSTADDVADYAAPDSRGGYGSISMTFEVSFLRLRPLRQ